MTKFECEMCNEYQVEVGEKSVKKLAGGLLLMLNHLADAEKILIPKPPYDARTTITQNDRQGEADFIAKRLYESIERGALPSTTLYDGKVKVIFDTKNPPTSEG